MSDINLEPALFRPSDFRFGEVSSLTTFRDSASSVPSLGPLAAFTGVFHGSGFNTIFRPDLGSPTKLPVPVSESDNLLELNLTQETLSFSQSLGSVPNRGEVMPDIFLNGVPYLQVITDVTVPRQPVGIHFEPGLWMAIPATTDPREGTDRDANGVDSARHDDRGPGNLIHHRRQARYRCREHHPVHYRPAEQQDPVPEPDRVRQGHGAHPAGPDVVRQGRHDHAGHAGRPRHPAAQPHRVAEHHVHDRHRRLDPAGCPAVRRRDDNMAFLLGDPQATSPTPMP